MKKLILLALLFVGCVFGDTITYNQGNNKRIIENVKFTRAGNGKVYFTIYGKESSRNCNQIIEFTDDDGNPIDYDCSVLLIEPMKTNDNDSLLNNNSKENAVIDSLIRLIDTKLTNSTDELAKLIDENTKKILNEVLWVDPLKDKKFGIEINPFYLIAGSLLGERGVLLSGSYSRFDINETAEIAFPFYLLKLGGELKWHVDSQYRKFIGLNNPHQYRSGFYIMGGMRFGNFDFAFHEKKLKLGITFGFGSRIFGKNGWYWGWSLYAGKYFNLKNGVIIDYEIFKFGRTF